MDYIAQFKQETTLILLSAGNSTRFSQNGFPKKQWLRIKSIPLWRHLVDVFSSFGFKNIWVTASSDEITYAQKYFPYIVEGGETRTQSILKALEKVKTPYVLIHDVARFYPVGKVIEALLDQAYHQGASCVAPRIKVADTLYCVDGSYPKREDLYVIQTPQISKVETLKLALMSGEFSDESSAMSAFGEKVAYIEGSSLLHKLTTPDDLFFAKSILNPPSQQIFCGGGIDIHGFEEGKKMVLCGVEIESPVGFKAHSDGDVGIHAVIDALLGAMGAGDIGEWFPDTDEKYHNADSKLMLQKINAFLQGVGYEIVHLDLTILAQAPKISPYKIQMQERLAELLGIERHQINIKATTAERLGFVGRKEGICVLSQVSLQFRQWSEL